MVPAESLAPVLALRGERRLLIGEEIGTGSGGTVYVARLDQVLAGGPAGDVMSRIVAVKIVDRELARDPDAMQELRRSVRRVALVRHPNVVGVTDYFVATFGEQGLAAEPVPCVVEELVDGMSLASFVARHEASGRRIPLDLALFVACEIAEGLAGARAATSAEGVLLNMAHHNLGPRQVLLSWNGEVKLGDFGWRPPVGMVSGVRRADRDLRAHLAHLAPEVALGSRGDGRSDVFSLGVILHEMLFGPRFRGTPTSQEMLGLVRKGVVDRPVASPLLPPPVAAIVGRALSADPRERQAHAGIVAYDLRREALALGVADGRMFLRSALFDMSEGRHDTGR